MRPSTSSALLTVLLLSSASVSAQEVAPEMLDAEARARFELAMVHIESGRFEEAAREFHAAYELSQRAELLYNEFLAWRDGGFPGRAADSLEAFIATLDADDPDRGNLEARVRPLREQAERLRAAEAEGRAARSPPDEPAPPPIEERASSEPHPVGFALIGVGAAVAIAGGIVGAVALSLSDDLAGACASGVCPEDRREDADTGAALAIAADVLLPVGAATAVVGLILLLTVTEGDSPSAALACDGAGCVGAVRGVF